jgi:hypothetical protein
MAIALPTFHRDARTGTSMHCIARFPHLVVGGGGGVRSVLRTRQYLDSALLAESSPGSLFPSGLPSFRHPGADLLCSFPVT